MVTVPGLASYQVAQVAGVAYRGPAGEIVGHSAVVANEAPVWTRSPAAEITAAEARGNSRPVSSGEFQRLAAAGAGRLAAMTASASPAAGLTGERWEQIVEKSWQAVQAPWGGATWDAHTGEAVEDGADRYALTARPPGVESVRIPESASEAEFAGAMYEARDRFASILQADGAHLGVFHDDDEHRIDIDPAIVVDSIEAVEQIGAWTHATGGAYHFATGDGFFPPHVADSPAPVLALSVPRRTSPASSPWLAAWLWEDDHARRAA